MDQFMPNDNKDTYLDSKVRTELKLWLGDLYEPLMQIRQSVRDGFTVQARMLEDLRIK
jgi:protease-4